LLLNIKPPRYWSAAQMTDRRNLSTTQPHLFSSRL
jgi:hypothetical protein